MVSPAALVISTKVADSVIVVTPCPSIGVVAQNVRVVAAAVRRPSEVAARGAKRLRRIHRDKMNSDNVKKESAVGS